MIRVLVICQEDPEYLLGGMGRHLQELYKAMATRDDVKIDLLVSGPASESYEYNGHMKHHSEKLLCYKPKAANMASLLVADIQLATTLMRLIAEGKRWDVIHVHEWNSMQVARMARRALGVPLVGTMHLCISHLMEAAATDATEYMEPDIYLMQQEGHLIVDVDELILCSQAYIDLARKIFLTKRHINLIYNGIRADQWSHSPSLAAEIRRKFNLSDKPIALFVGRIAEMKGIRELLEAVETWDDCPYQFVLAGEVNANSEREREGWDVTRKIRELEKLHPDRLRWLGFQDDQTLRALYSGAEIGVMNSEHEPFGIVILEMLAAGLPVVSTEVDGLGEIVNGSEGKEYTLIIEPKNPQQIREAMQYLRDHPAARKKLSYLGKKRALDFNWDHIAEQTIEVYLKAIANGGKK